nr:acyl-CoA dehydrogenase family protein [Bradyrhizobium sp. CCBAU 25338]
MTDTIKIRSLNDSFRQTLVFGGTVLVTSGVTRLTIERQAKLLELVRTFDRFTLGNDSHGEHDFGSIELDATRFFFRIDYYDRDGRFASPDPADATVTRRVMTIMKTLRTSPPWTMPGDAGAKGISLIVVETSGADGYKRGRNLDKIGLHASDTSELFFDNVTVPPENLLGKEEGQGFVQLMQQLPQERLSLAVGAVASMERAVKLTADYTKERKAFGKPLLEFQNTAFTLAERKTEAMIARVFVDWCIERLVAKDLDTVTASMAKYWCSDKQVQTADECLQLFGGYGYMQEYPISRIFVDSRIQKIYGGTNEIMKLLIARSL